MGAEPDGGCPRRRHGRGRVTQAAAALLGFEGFRRDAVEVTLGRAARSVERSWTVHTTTTTTTLPPLDRTHVGVLPCTSASRTIIDLARMSRPDELQRSIGFARREGLTSQVFLRKRLTELRGPGRHGVRLIDELLGDADVQSVLERVFLELCEAPDCRGRSASGS